MSPEFALGAVISCIRLACCASLSPRTLDHSSTPIPTAVLAASGAAGAATGSWVVAATCGVVGAGLLNGAPYSAAGVPVICVV